jgi:hypothetical protein
MADISYNAKKINDGASCCDKIKKSKLRKLIIGTIKEVLKEYSVNQFNSYKELDRKLKSEGWHKPSSHYRTSSLLNLEKEFGGDDIVEFYVMRKPIADGLFKDVLYISGIYKGRAVGPPQLIHSLDDIYHRLKTFS